MGPVTVSPRRPRRSVFVPWRKQIWGELRGYDPSVAGRKPEKGRQGALRRSGRPLEGGKRSFLSPKTNQSPEGSLLLWAAGERAASPI
jgi:hypothetical protein